MLFNSNFCGMSSNTSDERCQSVLVICFHLHLQAAQLIEPRQRQANLHLVQLH